MAGVNVTVQLPPGSPKSPNRVPTGPTGPVPTVADGTLNLNTVNYGTSVAGTIIVPKNVTGTGNLVVGATGTVVDRNIRLDSNSDKRVLSEELAFERIGAAVKQGLEDLGRNLNQARADSKQIFTWTLIAGGSGFMIVLVGAAILLAGHTSAGAVSAIAGFIPEVAAGMFYRKDSELRQRIERYHQHILESQRLLTMIDVAETVRDEGERDALKREIIFSALKIPKD